MIVDNASSDNTRAIVDQQKHPLVRYVRNPENIGFAKNLQKILESARGEFLVFLSADDYLDQNYLAKTLPVVSENPSVSFVHTGHDIVSESGAFLERRVYPWKAFSPEKEFLLRLAEWDLAGVCLSSALIRTSFLKEAGGIDVSLDHAADYGMWFRLCGLGPVGYVPEPLVFYRVHPSQSTGILKPGLRLQLTNRFLRTARENNVDLGRRASALWRKAVWVSIREILSLL